MTTALPLIDISRFRDSSADREEFLAELRYAAHEVGFFYVVGHGVPDALTSGIFEVARRFFALPLQQRLAIENIHSPQFRGYTSTGHEYTAGSPDWREQIDIGPERAAVAQRPGDPAGRRVIGPSATPGGLTAPRRRVVSPPAGVDRYSVPFFLGPRLDAVVEPLKLPPELAAGARGISQDGDNPLLAEFGENALVGWLRSHPKVAQ